MTPKTSKYLEEVKERERKATNGKWVFVSREQLSDQESDVVLLEGNFGCGSRPLVRIVHGWLWTKTDENGVQKSDDAENGNFIAHARTDIPKLLNIIEDQETVIEKIKNELSWSRNKRGKQ